MSAAAAYARADVPFDVSPTLVAWMRAWNTELLAAVDYSEPYDVRRVKHPFLHDWPSSPFPATRCPHCSGVLE